ncbi:MAG: hypothetical protein A3E82_07645 [Gammaproteobacteria bacterium RIFCSPHIGHO2_12_FULL_38_11]|nr:MAG: hypothetical protein A3E82_07645 [Gammaproteobacteria bacterium RIFCSPHIGHO2_12_FULL_38_11]
MFLTLKDRPNYTKRWLAYASAFNCPFHILIADGSKTSENEDIIKSYLSKLDIEYCRYPYDENYEMYYRKVADAASKINTPFVIQVDNDDLYDFSVFSEGLELLLQDSSYSSCCVQRLVFTVKKPFSISFSPEMPEPSIKLKNAHERLSYFLDGSRRGVCYNILRVPFYQKIWRDIVGFDFHDIRSFETLINVAGYATGNVIATSSYGFFRECSGQENSSQIETNTLKEIMNPAWIRDNTIIANYVADILMRQDGFDREDAIKLYFDGMRNTLSQSIVRDLLNDPALTDNRKKFIRSTVLKDVISNSLLNKPARKIYEKLHRMKKKEVCSLPILPFLEEWYAENTSGFSMKS